MQVEEGEVREVVWPVRLLGRREEGGGSTQDSEELKMQDTKREDQQQKIMIYVTQVMGWV